MTEVVDWICAAENTGYNAWQAMLFHYSIFAHTRRPPIIAVMANDGEPLRDEFEIIKRTGGRVQRCRNYRHQGYAELANRNVPGAMIEVEAEADRVAICDTDMLLTRNPLIPRIEVNQTTVDNLPWYFLFPEHDTIRSTFDRAIQRAGLERDRVVWPRVWGGVPYVMHRDVMPVLGREWLSTIEIFLPQGPADTTEPSWDSSNMWGFQFACAALGIGCVRTRWCTHNTSGAAPFDPWWSIIHYAWGEKEEFSKFGRDKFPDEELTATPGSINEQIVNQIHCAREWYRPITEQVGLAS